MHSERPDLNIIEWTSNNIEIDHAQLGLSGSPTKVKTIENVVLQAKDSKRLTTADSDINNLMVELITNHTLG